MEVFFKNIGSYKIFDTQNKLLGDLEDLIIDPENGKIIAFKLKNKDLHILFIDLIKTEKNFLIIKNADLLKKIFSNGKNNYIRVSSDLKGKKVRTQNSKNLGEVCDVIFDLDNGYIKSILVENKILLIPIEKHNISYENIVEIKKDSVIVKDILITNKNKALEYCS